MFWTLALRGYFISLRAIVHFHPLVHLSFHLLESLAQYSSGKELAFFLKLSENYKEDAQKVLKEKQEFLTYKVQQSLKIAFSFLIIYN